LKTRRGVFNEGFEYPDVREDVYRNKRITIEYCEEDFE
jgi:peptide deformylase